MSAFFELNSYRDILKSEFESRRKKNPRYSMRAFARDMGADAGHMTRIFNGTKGLSRLSANRLIKRLEYTSQKKRYFLNLIQISHGKDTAKIKAAKEENKHLQEVMKQRVLEVDSFAYISDWTHYAILTSLILTDGQLNSSKLSKLYQLTEKKINECVDRLVRLGIIEEIKANQYKVLDQHVRVESQDNPTQAIRSFHRGLISKAIDSIEEQSPDERELSSLVLTFDRSQLGKAKAFIRDFESSFREQFAHSKSSDSIYALSVQFFKVAGKEDLS